MHPGTLYAISDLHVAYAENRALLDGLRPDLAARLAHRGR